jgi:hypothetical protein
MILIAACTPKTASTPVRSDVDEVTPPEGDDPDAFRYGCETDADCSTTSTCDCTRCIAYRTEAHPEPCPDVCEADPCGGHAVVCQQNRCTLK